MKFRSGVLGSRSKNLWNYGKIKNFELLVKEIFELRVLENSSSNP